MKKIGIIVAMIALFAASVSADDRVVSPEKLPQKAKDFITTNFAGQTIQYVEQDFDDYEVQLRDGSEIKFKRNGEWEEVKSYNGIPATVLPATAGTYLSSNFADAKIMEVEKDWNGFEVKLSNRMEVFFDKSGKHLGQKHDD